MPPRALLEKVLAQTRACLNPSSLHRPGQRARALIEHARELVRNFIGAERRDHIIFTSGATEANSLALRGAVVAAESSLLTTTIEHHSVLEVIGDLAARGQRVRFAAPGQSDFTLAHFESEMRSDLGLLSVMAANNETGLILPSAEIARRARECAPQVIIHSDAVQIFGRAPSSINELAADMLTISGHKLGALAGVGCLVAREHVTLKPQLLGGPQERRLRAGTENLVGIVSLAEAIDAIGSRIAQRQKDMFERREYLWCAISRRCDRATRLFNSPNTLANTLSLSFAGVRSDDLLVALDLRGVSVSAGSACASGRPEPSHVLLAHGLTTHQAREVIRISLGGDEEFEDLDYAAAAVAECANTIKSRNFD